MWTRDLLKQNAKQALRTHYWKAFLLCIVCGLLAGGGSGASYTVSAGSAGNLSGTGFFNSALGFFLSVFALLAAFVAIAFSLFVASVVVVGRCRYFMESRLGESPFGTLFSAFGGPHYLNIVFVQFMKSLFIFLWSLLFIIPGIVKGYQYRMVDYLLAENPGMDYRRALELSRQMTDGEKWDMFVLDLSFIGWFWLGALALGIGVLFVTPYYEATWAEFYAAMRAKAFSTNMADETELGDFYRH